MININAIKLTPKPMVHFDMMSSKLCLPLNDVLTLLPPDIASPFPVMNTNPAKRTATMTASTFRTVRKVCTPSILLEQIGETGEGGNQLGEQKAQY